MIDIVRTSLHRAITSPVGDEFLPGRLPKDLARRDVRLATRRSDTRGVAGGVSEVDPGFRTWD